MRVLHAAVEYFPLVKTGGLADVMGALPKAQLDAGADVRLVLPGLPAIMAALKAPVVVAELGAVMGAARARLLRGGLHDGLQAYVIDAPMYYAREGNPYVDAAGKEWSDNARRFALLGWVAAHLSLGELDPSWQPQVLHAHDWHAAMACAYLAAHPIRKVGSVFTVHNLAYQGLFDGGDFHLLDLPARFMTPQGIEFHGQFSFMKAGLHYADRITTVSPTYASEMAQSEFGWGLDGLIRSRKNDVSGILNGVDPAIWDPQSDREIAAGYSAKNLKGKAQCKAALQAAMGLKRKADMPLFGIVSRLTSQKGLDLVLAALPTLVADGAQLALLGSGDAALEAAFREAAAAHPEQVAVHLGYDEAFAHQMMAGIDSILVPSRFEPCGLTQLYGLRYGSVPLVRHVGGLADTVVDASEIARGNDTATGFIFGSANVQDLIGALRRAIQAYAEPKLWQQIQRRGMAQNFSWARSAEQYLALYDEVLPG